MPPILGFYKTCFHQCFLSGCPLSFVTGYDQQADQRVKARQSQNRRRAFWGVLNQTGNADLEETVERRDGLVQLHVPMRQRFAVLLNPSSKPRIGASAKAIGDPSEIERSSG